MHQRRNPTVSSIFRADIPKHAALTDRLPETAMRRLLLQRSSIAANGAHI